MISVHLATQRRIWYSVTSIGTTQKAHGVHTTVHLILILTWTRLWRQVGKPSAKMQCNDHHVTLQRRMCHAIQINSTQANLLFFSQVTRMLTNQVQALYKEQVSNNGDNEDRSSCIHAFIADNNLVASMQMLHVNGVTDVVCNDCSLVQMCGTPLCHRITVSRRQCDNAQICGKYTDKKQDKARSEKTRQQNWYKQVASDSLLE